MNLQDLLLELELRRWRQAGHRARLTWRDGDAASVSTELDWLLAMSRGLATPLTVTSEGETEVLTQMFARVKHLAVVRPGGEPPSPRGDRRLDLVEGAKCSRFRGRARFLADLRRELAHRRREEQWETPIDLLSHHRTQDDSAWQFLESFILWSRGCSQLTWVGLATQVGRIGDSLNSSQAQALGLAGIGLPGGNWSQAPFIPRQPSSGRNEPSPARTVRRAGGFDAEHHL